jgi:hypothetical protein
MARGDFKGFNPADEIITTARRPLVNETNAVISPREEQKEAKVIQEETKTRVQKLPRINMAFSEENIEYLGTIARIKGMSKTEYVNYLITRDKKDNQDLLKSFKSLMD